MDTTVTDSTKTPREESPTLRGLRLRVTQANLEQLVRLGELPAEALEKWERNLSVDEIALMIRA